MAHILIIDDDPRILALVAGIVEAEGHSVSSRIEGAAGIETALAEPQPDLVITDLNMRGVSGWEVLRRIRQAETKKETEAGAGRNLPILALSAFTSAQDRDEAFEAGCTAYENKPIDRDRLTRRIRDLIAGL